MHSRQYGARTNIDNANQPTPAVQPKVAQSVRQPDVLQSPAATNKRVIVSEPPNGALDLTRHIVVKQKR